MRRFSFNLRLFVPGSSSTIPVNGIDYPILERDASQAFIEIPDDELIMIHLKNPVMFNILKVFEVDK